MSLPEKLSLRRAGIALGALAIAALMIAAPASADRGRRWHSGPARVGIFVGVPPIVFVAGGPPRYYDPYRNGGYRDGGYGDYRDDGYRAERRERVYDRGYEDGYDDGYGDRAREEWYRRQRHYHRDCD